MASARRQGHHVWTVNHRGCGAGRGLAARPYHSGSGDDLGAAFALGRERHPSLRQLALGFSLSANALLLNLGDGLGRPLPKPDLAIAVNAPKDDPFIPWRAHAEAATSPFVHLHLEDHGGHMGYLSRGLPGHRWLPYALEHYMAELLRLRGAGKDLHEGQSVPFVDFI